MAVSVGVPCCPSSSAGGSGVSDGHRVGSSARWAGSRKETGRATSGKDARAAREAKLDALYERLTGAVEQLVSGGDWAGALALAARFRARSFANTILIFTQRQEAYGLGLVPDPVPSHVAGYRQWQQLGRRQVSKGQPGYQILAPVTGRFASATPQDAESWRRLGKGEKPRAGETVRTKMVGVRPAYVWDVSQT